MSRADYDADFYAWTQEQAALLRALPRSNALDIDLLAEEIEDMGREQLNKVSSLLRQIFIHLIKLAVEHDPQPILHWKGEIAAFQADLLQVYAPSMRQRIELDSIWKTACKVAILQLAAEGRAAGALPRTCPWTLDPFLDQDFSPEPALSVLAAALDRKQS
jgi:hypothetical protein